MLRVKSDYEMLESFIDLRPIVPLWNEGERRQFYMLLLHNALLNLLMERRGLPIRFTLGNHTG